MKQRTIAPRRNTFQLVTRAAVLVAGMGLAAAVVPVQPATAEVLEHDTYHITYGPDPACDGPFTQEGVADGRFLVVARGPDDVAYYMEDAKFNDTVTNTVTGATVTVHGLYTGLDLEITSQPDGTMTVLEQFTGTYVMYAEDGSVLGRGAGNSRVELTFDENGGLVSMRQVKDVGLGFDYCATIEQAIG